MDSFRGAVLGTIAFVAFLLVVLAAIVVVFDASEKAMAVIGIVVTGLFGLIGNVIVYLKIDGVESKADTAAVKAEEAAKRTEAIHHDVLNGPMRENVKRAYQELEADPAIQARRIENVAKGVSKDRHDLKNREAVEQGYEQMAERRRKRDDERHG